MRIVTTLIAGIFCLAFLAAAGADEFIPGAQVKPNTSPYAVAATPVAQTPEAGEPQQKKNKEKTKGKEKEKEKEKAKEKGKAQPPPPASLPSEDIFAAAPAPGVEAPIGLNPNMIGDFPGFFSLQHILVPGFETISTTQQTLVGFRTITVVVGDGTRTERVPIYAPTTVKVTQPALVSTTAPVAMGFYGSLKVGENQSPMPQDRVYLTYNYYNNAGISTPGQVSTQIVNFNGFPTAVTTVAGSQRTDIHQEMFGFEKTFLDGNGSIAMRLPFTQIEGDGTIGQQNIGNMSWLLNYALFRNATTGNVLTGGLMATLPTGPPQYTVVGNIQPTIFQPFTGYRWGVDRFYFQGFTSLPVPTDPRFVTALFNDFSAGYWIYRSSDDRLITALIPTIEAHVTTPLNNRSPDSVVTVPNIVALTAGLHIGVRNRAFLTLGVVVPVTGPQVFPIEAVAQMNWRW